MKRQKLNRYIFIVGIISLGMSLLVHFNSILSLFNVDGTRFHGYDRSETISNVALEVIITSLVAFCTFVLNYFIIRPFDGLKKTGWKRPIISVVLTLISVYIFSDLFFAAKHLITGADNPNKFVLLFFFRDLFMAIMVLICIYIIKGFYEKQEILIENEKLILENLQSQYQSLKNQVSPHFLFNSLTALRELIGNDPENAKQYVNNLSTVLRYTLQSNESKTVSLEDEIITVNSYIFLLKMRYDSNLQIEFRTEEKYNSYRLPPLTLQTLIENAVKHNEISRRNPLTIRIFTNDSPGLTVSNILNEKLSLEPGTGIGLSNLSKQYKLLTDKDISITRSDTEFNVEIPLLTPFSDESSNS